MKITVFTGNQARHISLIEDLAGSGHEVFWVQEGMAIGSGKPEGSGIVNEYFSHVRAAEAAVFGTPRFSPPGTRGLCLPKGDLSVVELSLLRPALDADAYIIFGASFIKGPLCDFLVGHGAVNLHMGLSPYYRGSACNFWALYDGRPDLVGATIHRLSRGLDSGPILFHAVPPPQPVDGFMLGMLAVKAGLEAVVAVLGESGLDAFAPVDQDKSRELRYSRGRDFTDAVVQEYLGRLMSPEQIREAQAARPCGLLVNPFVSAS